MKLRFTKMHGLGNDFVVIDGISQKVRLSAEKVKRLADRRFGVGCDQVLIVEVPQNPDVDFRYRIYNHDGSEVENCGNGARCFARFVQDRKLSGKNCIKVETAGGLLTLNVLDNGDVCVDMGEPVLEPAKIPFVADNTASSYTVSVDPEIFGRDTLELSAVSMGNPHGVVLVDDVDTAAVDAWGKAFQNHQAFPSKVNVGFLQIISRNEVRLRVFERGVGETLACGTGACAAVVAGHLRELLDSKVRVSLPGGSMDIDWQGPGHTVLMTGPATSVFHGQVKV